MYVFKPKSSSFIMRLIGKFNKPFYEYFWTTIGNTIYYPTSVTDPHQINHLITVTHELVHVRQFRKYSIPLFLFLYLFVPLPFFFSYFRWKFEREAYMVQLKRGAKVDDVVNVLSSFYGKPWPKTWMKKWFEKEIKDNRI